MAAHSFDIQTRWKRSRNFRFHGGSFDASLPSEFEREGELSFFLPRNENTVLFSWHLSMICERNCKFCFSLHTISSRTHHLIVKKL